MPDVTLLTQPSCFYCDHAKEIINRLSSEYPLRVTEIGIQTEDGEELAIKHAVLFGPGILLDGKLFSYGRLSEKKLRKYLERKEAKL